MSLLGKLKTALGTTERHSEEWAVAYQRYLTLALYTYFPPVRFAVVLFSLLLVSLSSYVCAGARLSDTHAADWRIAVL